MSLELALQENTNTMKLLIDAWKQLAINARAVNPAEPFNAGGVPVNPAATPVAGRSPEADHQAAKADVAARRAEAAKAQDPKPAAASQPTGTAAATPASSPVASSPAPSTVTYDDVKTLVLQVSKEKGRDTAAGILAGLGVAKAPELKPEQYATAVVQLKAALK